MLFGALALGAGGCAGTTGSGGTQDTTAASESSADPCRAAIEDVSEFCSEDNLNSGKCSDAKARTRDLCI